MIRTKTLTLLGAAFVAVAVAAFTASAAEKQQPATQAARPAPKPKYGAFALSPILAGLGSGYEWPDRKSAENAAMNSCKGISPAATDCKIILWFYNTCGAVAMAPDGTYGVAYDQNQKAANKAAIKYCKQFGGKNGCTVHKSICTGVDGKGKSTTPKVKKKKP